MGTSELVGATKVYMHSGVILSSETGTSWQNVIGNWGSDDGVGEMTKVAGESDKWEITIDPRTYYNVPSAPVYRIGMVFRNADGSDEGKSDSNSDIFVDLLQSGFGLNLLSPSSNSFFVDQNDEIQISVAASENADFELFVNDISTDVMTGTDTYNYTHTVSESTGSTELRVSATNGAESDEVSITYTVKEVSPLATIPPGIIKGINYQVDETKVTLCLEAPLKSSVYVVGEFNNWVVSADYLMNKDGDLFWLEIDGLTPNVEYGFQYLVDQNIYVADPYTDKVLDPDDVGIPTTVYPDLKEYPQEAFRDLWYQRMVSVFQTGQADYQWEAGNFEHPAKDELVIYEILIRDYFGVGQRSYQNLIDTLSYLSELGVNAVELMPITEFRKNESWGYDNTFMFAPDKAYGPKEDLKKFIDEAHKLGIAVILDIVMNHHENSAPNVSMYFEGNSVTNDNPWFNVSAPHQVLGFFYDFNHESTYTQNYLDSLNRYWLREYKVDGFRFDLSKGFTQKQTTGFDDWGAYDQGRIDILKRMADVIWDQNPDTYIILEHFGDNSEEEELSDYGMMLWGNLTHAYSQLAMGFSAESNITGVAASTKGWTDNHLVGYMESHDEERMMYKCVEFGNENSNYSTQDYNTALERVMAASSFFYTVPGPKMLWQFGETGFDYSINRCTDGSIDNNCRLSIKPTTWDYLENEENQHLLEVTSELIHLKTTYGLFQSGDVSFFNGTSLGRHMWITQNDLTQPTDPSEMNAVVVGNFDISARDIQVTFPHDGKWYHYFDQGDSIESTGAMTYTFQPGEFKIYTDVKLEATTPELMQNLKPTAPLNLTASDETDGILLSWEDRSTINTGYFIYRKETGTDWELVDTTGDIESYLDKGILPESSYQYQVASYNLIGERRSEIIDATSSNFVLGLDITSAGQLYPNPTRDFIKLSGEKTYSSYSIYTLNGKMLKQGELHAHAEIEISISDISAGTYILKLSHKEASNSFRFTKN